MTREFIDFVEANLQSDTAQLLLSAARYPAIDMPLAVRQIEGRRTAREKWPSLLDHESYLYPPRLNREQASSEATAAYKAALLASLAPGPSHIAVADLTGGMGIDSIAFAKVAKEVHYVERDPDLCTLTEQNLRTLGIGNVQVHHADSIDWLNSQFPTLNSQSSILFIDPARRDARGRKVAAFEDCSPNILEHRDLLRQCCNALVVKASPMIDIDLAARQLGSVTDIHVVAHRGECKEVLFVCREGATEPLIHCVDLPQGELLAFTRSTEAAAEPLFANTVGRYLYEPCPTLMKGGPFRTLCTLWGMPMLAPNTHLYTSDSLHDLPARTFEVLREVAPSRKGVADALPERRAHVVVRNYPAAAADLQRRMGLGEGGDLFVVATTIGRRHTALICKQIHL